MKKLFAFFIAFEIFFGKISLAQNTFPSSGAAGIGTTSPNSSSLLDVTSTSKGILIPRMTKAQRDAIASPAQGLLIFQTNSTSGFYFFNGTSWTAISSKGANSSLSNLTSPTAVNADLLPGSDNTINVGSVSNSWKDLYLDGSVYLGGSRFLSKGTGQFNTAVGDSSLISNTTGFGNTATGAYSLLSNTTGQDNEANGGDALFHNTIGNGNTAIGSAALYSNSTGDNNTATGEGTLFWNSTGGQNTATGSRSLYNNSTGEANTATGNFALTSNTTGESNTATGLGALSFNVSGNNNTASGTNALELHSLGDYNTADGVGALQGNENGDYGFYNTASGALSLWNNQYGYYNVANGYHSLYNNIDGNNNTASGYNSLQGNTEGSHNTASGDFALSANETGNSNVGIGDYALTSNTNKSNLVAIGDSALYNNGGAGTLDGTANAAVGSKALFANTTGRANSAMGFQTLYSNTTGIHNSGVGYHSIYALTTASDNTAVGYTAGFSLLTGSSNTFIGSGADCGSLGTVSNSTAVGNGASVTNSNNFVFGNGSVTKWGFGHTANSGNIVDFVNTTAKLTTGGTWTNASDRRLKDGFVKLDSKNILDKVNALDIERWHYIADGEPVTHIGPVAQDFHEAFGVGDDTTISTIDPSGVALLAIQALSKQNDELKSENENLKAKNDAQDELINSLQARMDQLDQSLSQCCMSYQSPSANKNSGSTTDVPRLDQNVPNPFDQETTIQFYLPSKFSLAQIIVSDLTGKMLKTLEVQGSGVNQVTIHNGELAAGTYQYSLLIDGKIIDTKQMVLTK